MVLSTRIKICGITNAEDAAHCSRLGAHYLGFIFYPQSLRAISPQSAAQIISTLPGSVTPVGVFVNAARESILETVNIAGIRIIQMSGDETPDDCGGYDIPVWKAFRFRNIYDVPRAADYRIDACVIDGAPDGIYGGSGTMADTSVALELKGIHPLMLAGGLNPENIADAVRKVMPFGVDVNSGVEQYPGKKNPEKVESLFKALTLL